MPQHIRTYDIGDVALIRGRFRHPTTGSGVDPAIVVFKTLDEDGTEATYTYEVDDEVTRSAAGDYQLRIEPTVAGTWTVRLEGTGGYKAAREVTFEVLASSF